MAGSMRRPKLWVVSVCDAHQGGQSSPARRRGLQDEDGIISKGHSVNSWQVGLTSPAIIS